MATKEYIKVTSCGAIAWRYDVKNEFEILLIKQFAHRDIWGIPKGHIKEHESLEQCAIREVKEESGVFVDLMEKLTPVATAYGNEEKTVHAWLAKAIGSTDPSMSDPDCEIAAVAWFNVTKLPTIHLYQRSLIEEAVTTLKMSYGLYLIKSE